MKKFFALLLALVMVISLVACGETEEPTPETQTPETESTEGGFTFNRQIELMIPGPEGSSVDITARRLAELLKPELGVDVLVTDMAGGSGVTGFTWAKDQTHDGYFYCYSSPSFVGAAKLGNFDFDVLNSITPMCSLLSSPDVFFTGGSNTKFSNFDEMKEYALAHPGDITVAVQSTTGIDGASMGQFLANCGFELTMVNYQEEAIAAVISGDVDLMMSTYGECEGFLESGDMKAIIALNEERLPELPDIPCTVEEGIDCTLGPWFGFFCFNETPTEARDAFIAAVEKVTATAEWRDYLESLGYIAEYKDSAGFAALVDETAEIMEASFAYFAK